MPYPYVHAGARDVIVRTRTRALALVGCDDRATGIGPRPARYRDELVEHPVPFLLLRALMILAYFFVISLRAAIDNR